jgi:hypothetical protein
MDSFDLVNWTMRKARQLSPEVQMPRETEGSHLLDKLLEVLEGGARKKPSDFAASAPETNPRIASATGVWSSNEVAHRTETNAASDLPVSALAAPLAPADIPVDRVSALLRAIVQPDLRKDHPADRERAIMLRWVLRDIKARRLTLSPVVQHDLQDLIDVGLVEMRSDAPVLTKAGVNAIL